jgi:hypothetical protein
MEETMTKTFAKLFDTPSGQLLATRDEQEDDDTWPIRMRGAEVGGCTPASVLGFYTEAERDAAFDRICQADAEKSAAHLRSAVVAMTGGAA